MVLRALATAGGIPPIVRILYLGLPLGALHLDRLGHGPKVVALGHPRAPGARRVRRRLGARGALILGRPALDAAPVEAVIQACRPDVLLSWFWPWRIPPWLLTLPPRGAFGVHPSLLPRWRGPDPYFWALARGDTKTGVTLHRLAPEYDTGLIVTQRALAIRDDDDAWSLARRLDTPSLELLGQAADRLARGETLEGRAQDEDAATLAPRPSPEDLAIDWRRGVNEILRLVRAASPHPGASADFAGHAIDVVAAERHAGSFPAALEVAQARCVDGGVAVRAGDGVVLVTAALSGEQRLTGTALHALLDEAQSS